MNQPNLLKFKKGFTLIELLVVIAVIGVVFSVIIATNPMRYIQGARDSRKKQDLNKVVVPMEACFTKMNESYTYCDTQEELINGGFLQTAIPDILVGASGCVSILLEAPLYPAFPYWRYSPETGKADYAPDGC
jgi:prepilin-type N-terminal cleavage/methylation domain-containing protein